MAAQHRLGSSNDFSSFFVCGIDSRVLDKSAVAACSPAIDAVDANDSSLISMQITGGWGREFKLEIHIIDGRG